MKRCVLSSILSIFMLAMHAAAAVVKVSGAIPNGTVWRSGDTILVTADATVPRGALLTLQPGVVVKFRCVKAPARRVCLDVHGRMNSLGTPANPVVFTSERDDAHGGDSNKDASASAAQAGDWGRIRVPGFGSTVQNCRFQYGGGMDVGDGVRPMLWIEGSGAPVDVTQCTFSDSAGIGLLYSQGPCLLAPRIADNAVSGCETGIVLDGWRLTRARVAGNSVDRCGIGIELRCTNPELERNRLVANTGHPLKLVGGASPTCRFNTVEGNAQQCVLISGEILGRATLGPRQSLGLPFLVATDLGIAPGGELTLQPGTIVKFPYRKRHWEKRGLLVRGSLQARGTWAAPIVFTSERDDLQGGDSNGDGDATAPSLGDWGTIVTLQVNDVVEHCVFRFGGYASAMPQGSTRSQTLWVQGGGETIDVSRCRFDE